MSPFHAEKEIAVSDQGSVISDQGASSLLWEEGARRADDAPIMPSSGRRCPQGG